MAWADQRLPPIAGADAPNMTAAGAVRPPSAVCADVTASNVNDLASFDRLLEFPVLSCVKTTRKKINL